MNAEDIIDFVKADKDFLQAYGLAFIYINIVEEKVGELLILKKYPELNSAISIVNEKSLLKKVAYDLGQTLGQKIYSVRSYVKNQDLMDKLELLNDFRIRLAHGVMFPNELGRWGFDDKKRYLDNLKKGKVENTWVNWDKQEMKKINILCGEIIRIIDQISEFHNLG